MSQVIFIFNFSSDLTTATLPQQKAFVTSTAVLGSLAGDSPVRLCLCYDTSILLVPIPSNMCLEGVNIPLFSFIPITISAIFQPPEPGTWRVGLCGWLETPGSIYTVTGNYVSAVVL